MQIIWDGKYIAGKSVVALGMFDGLHIGHQVLLAKAKKLAQRVHAPLIVCTFSEHPLATVAPEKCPPQLTTLQERCVMMEKLGVDVLYFLPFDTAVMNLLPEEYVGELVRRFHPTDVVCGYNHSFGKGGAGKPALLEFLGDALGFHTQIVPQITLNGEEISSTAIRSALAEGKMQKVRNLLGYCYTRQITHNEAGFYFADEKAAVPDGTYRVLYETEKKHVPLTLKIANGLPVSKKLSGNGSIAFISEVTQDESGIHF